jgi:hypothetical protein
VVFAIFCEEGAKRWQDYSLGCSGPGKRPFIDSSKRPAVMAPLSYCQLVRIGREKRFLVAIDSAQEISNELRVVR